MWCNYHTHSTWCDGKKSIPEIVQRAADLGVIALGLSSHAPLPFAREWCMKPGHFGAYLEEIDTLKSTHRQPELYAGLEVDFIPERISPTQFKSQLDYTVGSVHFVESFPDGNGWEIDNTYQVFRDGLERIFRNDIHAAVSRYFELTREMVRTAPPDIVGHIDKIKIHNRESLYNETDSWYREAVNQTLDVIRDAGCIVEVNTRGIYQKKTGSTYPSPWILQEINKRGIPVTLSSDAHHPDDLVNHFGAAANELLRVGFKKIRILLNGRWQDVAFDSNGIKTGRSYHPMA